MGIVFLGTPTFAVPTLEALLSHGYQVTCVVTQPDRPKGRHRTLTPSPVKLCALQHGLPVFQPERIRRPEAVEHLRALAPTTMVIVGYGQLIPISILDIAPIINVHASLLPKLRGAAPIQWSIARGDRTTGVTTMLIDAGLDTGDILLKAETPILPEEDAVTLSARLAPLGAQLLIETLKTNPAPEPQEHDFHTLAPILTKEDGRIEWHRRTALQIHNQIRGLQPWPGAHTIFRNQLLHIWRARVSEATTPHAPGLLLAHHPKGIAQISCEQNTVLDALEVQLEGRKRISAEAFLNGLHLEDNETLGAPLIS